MFNNTTKSITLTPSTTSSTVLGGALSSGATGQYLISNSNGTSWSDLGAVTISSSNALPTLQVNGDAEFKGDITVKGRNLIETLDRIEQRLNILKVNTKLESKWEKLKQLGDEYRALEADILEKEEILRILGN